MSCLSIQMLNLFNFIVLTNYALSMPATISYFNFYLLTLLFYLQSSDLEARLRRRQEQAWLVRRWYDFDYKYLLISCDANRCVRPQVLISNMQIGKNGQVLVQGCLAMPSFKRCFTACGKKYMCYISFKNHATKCMLI